MRNIPLTREPNQELTVRLDNQRLVLRLKEALGVMVADVDRDGLRVISGVRVLAGEPIIPYRYLESGNFLLMTLGGDLPDWREFGSTQQLVYVTQQEVETLRIGFDLGLDDTVSLGAQSLPFGWNTPAGRLLGSEPRGFALDFLENSALRRDGTNQTGPGNAVGPIASMVSNVRNTPAWMADASGNYQQFAANVLRRFDGLGALVEPPTTNLFSNPAFVGAVPGVIGSGGVLPTALSFTGTTGLTVEVLPLSAERGLTTIGFRLSGTTTSAGPAQLILAPVPAVQNAAYSFSWFIRALSGAAGISAFRSRIVALGDGGVVLNNNEIVYARLNDGEALTRIERSATLSEPTVQNVGARLVFATGPTGSQIDFTFRLAVPQLEVGAFATSPVLPAPGLVAQSSRVGDLATTSAADGYRGFMIDLNLLEPVLELPNRRIVAWRSTTGNEIRVQLSAAGTGAFITTSVGGVNASAPEVNFAAGSRQRLYGVIGPSGARLGVAGGGENPGFSAAVLPPPVSLISFGSNGLNTNNNAAIRARHFLEFPDVSDPAAAFAKVKATAEGLPA